MAASKNSNEQPRVQITLDPWVAMMIKGFESRKRKGETKKEVANNILREWLEEFIEKENLEDATLKEWSEEEFY